MIKKNLIRWLLYGWLIAGSLDYLLPHPQNVTLCDPATTTGAILIAMAISAASDAAMYGLSYIQAKRTKVAPIDRGKQDDIRISIPGYGEAIIKAWGIVRAAPVWIWNTPIVHSTVTTPGHSGGKGMPKPPTPATVDHIYTTSFAGVFHDGPIKNVRRMWFGTDLVWNTITDQLSATRYEAENAALAGGASVAASSVASGNSKVTNIGNGGTVTFSVTILDDGDYDIAVFFLDSTSNLNYEVLVDGVSHGTISCAQTGVNLMAAETIGLALLTGTRLIQFRNTSAACPDMDRIEVVETVSFTNGSLTDNRVFSGLTDPSMRPPTNQTTPWPTYNHKPILEDNCPAGYHLNPDTGTCMADDGSGPGVSGASVSLTANLAKWGSPQIRFYLGTADQTADPAIVADKGATNTPAWRGYAIVVIEGCQLPAGALPNVTIEFDQGTTAVPQIVTDCYALGNVGSGNLELSALAGVTISGVIRTGQKAIADTVRDLQTRFQFDLIEIDGVVKAVMRNRTTPDLVIPFSKLRAHMDNSEVPAQDATISDLDPLELPFEVDVNYLAPGKDFHNDTQFDYRQDGGPQVEVQSVSLALADTEHNMKRLASSLLYKPDMEGRTFEYFTGPEFIKAVPGSVIQIDLPNASHVTRVTSAKYSLPAGVVALQGCRQSPSLYSPTGFGSLLGTETPVGGFPSNTKLIILDGPLLRPEDAGDGRQPVIYVGMCGIGGGTWAGAFLDRESPIGSGEYVVETSADKASAIGVTVGALPSVSDPSVWDRTSSLTIDFYFDPLLASASESDILLNPERNLLAIKNPSTGDVEYIQVASMTPGVASSPFVARYTISTLLRGRAGTDGNVGSHTAADQAVLIDSTIKPRRLSLTDIGR